MMAEELEYHVTFPTKFSHGVRTRAAAAAAAIAGDDIELTERRSHQEPVIFLLGWYCAEEKELARYSAIYHSEGYITIRYVLPGEYLFNGKLGEVRDIASKVLEAFFDLGLEENPIFFHLFGNGGGYVYRAVTEILNGRDPGQFAALNVSGVIWDSAPCRPTLQADFCAYALYSPPARLQPWYISYLKTAPYWAWLTLKHLALPRYWGASRLMNSYIQAITDDIMPCPQLYMYSKADGITWYKDVQEIVQKRRERGLEVREVCWEDSGHLEHLTKHQEEYMDACLDFILLGVEFFEKGDN